MIIRERKTMSKKSNVNPEHYKVAGRDRPGEDILHKQNKQKLTQAKAVASEGAVNVLPGPQPGGQASHTAEGVSPEEQANSREEIAPAKGTAHASSTD
jgi:hypothetical protein